MSLGTAPYSAPVPLSRWERAVTWGRRWRAERLAKSAHADILHDLDSMTWEERDREVDRFLPPALRRYQESTE